MVHRIHKCWACACLCASVCMCVCVSAKETEDDANDEISKCAHTHTKYRHLILDMLLLVLLAAITIIIKLYLYKRFGDTDWGRNDTKLTRKRPKSKQEKQKKTPTSAWCEGRKNRIKIPFRVECDAKEMMYRAIDRYNISRNVSSRLDACALNFCSFCFSTFRWFCCCSCFFLFLRKTMMVIHITMTSKFELKGKCQYWQ